MEPFFDPMSVPVSDRPRECPRCGAEPLSLVAECEMVHWLCRSCGHCWRGERGHLRAVDPVSCPGCATKPRDECFVLFAQEFPRFRA